LSTGVFVTWECLPFSKRPAFRALLRCFWRDRVSVFCAAFADLAMFSNVSKHLLNICLFMDRLRGQEGEGILASRLLGCLGNCAKCRSRRRKKARKCPKIKSWWWHSLQGCPAPQPSRRAPRTPGNNVSTSSDRSCFNLPKAITHHHKLIISLLTMWPHSHDASSTASTLSGPASPDGYKRWPLTAVHFSSISQHHIKSKQRPVFLISLFPFFLCGHYFLAVYAQSFKYQQQ